MSVSQSRLLIKLSHFETFEKANMKKEAGAADRGQNSWLKPLAAAFRRFPRLMFYGLGLRCREHSRGLGIVSIPVGERPMSARMALQARLLTHGRLATFRLVSGSKFVPLRRSVATAGAGWHALLHYRH